MLWISLNWSQIQPETESVKMIIENPFVLSANIHGGDLVSDSPIFYILFL
jgi:hypothetical protein